MLRAGLEPARLSTLPPQDGVSTNSTTSAKIAYSFGAAGTSEALPAAGASVGTGTSEGADGTSF